MAAGEDQMRPLSPSRRRRIERAVRSAEAHCGLQFSVYLGPAGDDPRAHAHRLFADAQPAALLLVDPTQRRVEIVTDPAVIDRLPDAACAQAVTQMTAEFAAGDLACGVIAGLQALATAAGPGTAAPGTRDLPDLLGES